LIDRYDLAPSPGNVDKTLLSTFRAVQEVLSNAQGRSLAVAYITRVRIEATVTATGGASQAFYTPAVISGLIEAVAYAPATTSGISTNAHVTITHGGISAVTILTATATGAVMWYPRVAAQNVSATALGYTSAATPPMIPTRIPVGGERLRVEVSSAGTASNGGLRGTFDFYIAGA
jgi:hypothetical protein